MSNKIITISRQFGSGGHTIGKMVAEKLGLPFYDQEILQKVAEESGFAEKYVKDRSDYIFGGRLSLLRAPGTGGVSDQDLIWEAQKKIVRDIAEQGPCVIVGRCADAILPEKHDCLRVFIHADMQYRADRIVRVYGHREKSPEQRLREKDKARAAYYNYYADAQWGHAGHYDLTLNSGRWGFEKCVEMIADLYKL